MRAPREMITKLFPRLHYGRPCVIDQVQSRHSSIRHLRRFWHGIADSLTTSVVEATQICFRTLVGVVGL